VLDRPPGPLTGLVDLRFVAVAGQSLGGAAAAEAAQQGRRFAEVVDLDGFPRALALTRSPRSRWSQATAPATRPPTRPTPTPSRSSSPTAARAGTA
jgi:pimeloyl-ACP methyl ester carboxylesterase